VVGADLVLEELAHGGRINDSSAQWARRLTPAQHNERVD
jgi:hypothetical protein